MGSVVRYVGAAAAVFLVTIVVTALTITVDLASEGFATVGQWNAAPQIMIDRVPGYLGVPFAAFLIALGVVLWISHYVRCEVWLGCLFVFGLTATSIGWLVGQLAAISYELSPEIPPAGITWGVVVAGWVSTGAAIILLLRRHGEPSLRPARVPDQVKLLPR